MQPVALRVKPPQAHVYDVHQDPRVVYSECGVPQTADLATLTAVPHTGDPQQLDKDILQAWNVCEDLTRQTLL